MDANDNRLQTGPAMRFTPKRYWVFCVLTFLLVCVTEAEAAVEPLEFRLKHGDDPRWAAANWDDRDWEIIPAPPELKFVPMPTVPKGFPARAGIYWVRFRLERSLQRVSCPALTTGMWPADEPGAPINSLFIAAVFAYELYWDGRLIGRGGQVGGDYNSEVPGGIDNLIKIPDELLGPGPHTVALRLSSYHYNFPAESFFLNVALGNYEQRLVYEARRPIFPAICSGCALLLAVICAVLFRFVDRRRAFLLSGVLSFSLAVFYALIAWRWFHNDLFDWLYPRYISIAVVMAVISILLPWLLFDLFDVRRRRWWFLLLLFILAGMWTVSPLYQVKVVWMCRGMLVFSLGVTGWAVWRCRTGAWLALAGLIVGLLSVDAAEDRRLVLAPSFFLFFGMLVLALFGALGLQIRQARLRARQASLTAARLEIELLKKNIQPHFLLNTLTTIIEVIEQEPKSAVALIEALAEEFRILGRVSGEKLIPLWQDIELCRAHIRIMSLRSGLVCSLEVSGVDECAQVPPALFHTLIEGGFTHQLPRNGELKFTLQAEYIPGSARYTLVVHGENPALEYPPKEGTGLRYMKARLEESFSGRWSLVAGPVVEGWRTVIYIREDAEAVIS